MKNNIIGKNISKLRLENNLTQKEFGIKVGGYAARTVSNWENGFAEPNFDVARQIVKLFDITYEELIDG